MRFAALLLVTLAGCQQAEPTGQAQSAFSPADPMYIPSVIVPASQPTTVRRSHLGPTFYQWWDIDAGTVHVMAGDNVVASNSDYWEFEFGAWQDGGWSQIVFTSTRPAPDGGIGDMFGGRWYELPNAQTAVGFRSTLAVIATPHGSPDSPSFSFAMPNESIVP